MKKSLFFLFAATWLTITSNAQISKGSVFLGGNFRAYTNTGNNPNKQRGFIISPVYGKASRENLIWGVEAGVGFSSGKNEQTHFKQNGSTYNLGVFVRKYKPVGQSGFYIFMQGKVAGSYTKNKDRLLTDNSYLISESKNIGLYVNPGVSFAVSKRFHLESGFNNLFYATYGNNRMNDDGDIIINNSGFEINANLSNMSSQFYLGFRILIDRSKS